MAVRIWEPVGAMGMEKVASRKIVGKSIRAQPPGCALFHFPAPFRPLDAGGVWLHLPYGHVVHRVASTNPALPLSLWSNLDTALETPAGSGQFQFTDP